MNSNHLAMAAPQDFIDEHLDDTGRFKWPSDEQQREEMAQTIFGLRFIEALDGIVAVAEDWLTNAAPSRASNPDFPELAKMEHEFRRVFQTLNDDQRAAVSRLVRQSVSGALFATLADIDQFPYGRFDIAFIGEGDNKPVPISWPPLHDRFYEWRRQYSAYPHDDGGPAE